MLMISRTILYKCGHFKHDTVQAATVRNWSSCNGVLSSPYECRSCTIVKHLQEANRQGKGNTANPVP